MFRDDLLKDKRILITGGGSGVGRHMGRRFIELGAEVIVCSRRAALLEETVEEFTGMGGRASWHQLDIRVPGSVEEVVEAVWRDGPLDILVNNAAANFISRTEDLSPGAMDAILNPTLHGTFYMTVACGKRWLADARKGTVLSIVSNGATNGSAFTVPSAMAKAGIVAMTRSLAVEWGARGVRLNAIAPGPFPTKGAWERLLPTEELAKTFETGNPLGRAGRHSELVDLAAYLIADGSDYVHGELVTIDGGRWLQGAGTFNFLSALDDADWDGLKPKRGRDRG